MPNSHVLHLVPETDTAMLPRDSLSKKEACLYKNWTRHVYDHSELRNDEIIVHLFRCCETKQLRVWGFE